MILKKGWFSDLEILKICEPVSCEDNPLESPKWAETQNIENQNITEPVTTVSILTEERNNVVLF